MFGILNDVTKCIGCERCVSGCKERNNLGPDRPWRWRSGDGLSSDSWCSILRWPGGHNVRKMCRHCEHPACVSACPVAALHRTEDGAVVYRESRCMGCRYCMMACPYGIPRYSWEDTIPLIRKCVLCYEQTSEGGVPACVESCPTGATIFGDRDELLEQAHATIAANPERYLDKVWGETEVGGTAVLYITDVDVGSLCIQPNIGEHALPDLTWPALAAVPGVFLGVGATAAGLRWLTGRKQKVAEEAARAAKEAARTTSPDDGDDDDEKAGEDS